MFLVNQYDYSSIVDSVSISVFKYRRLRFINVDPCIWWQSLTSFYFLFAMCCVLFMLFVDNNRLHGPRNAILLFFHNNIWLDPLFLFLFQSLNTGHLCICCYYISVVIDYIRIAVVTSSKRYLVC
jgi:hypothetical protein